MLLVDDDPGDRELMRRALTDELNPCDLHMVKDGEEALDYLLRNGRFTGQACPTPDLVLLDLNMPRMDGRQVLERMRSTRDLRAIPVVILTTSDHEEDILRTYSLGCNSYIAKPASMPAFIEIVRDLSQYWFE
ncbi:MAG: response regulator, partial [Anaerolineales bacterium]|nr:response regulator [Anaerolineales bacterium]